MALVNTIQFLPGVFRTTTNQRFLGATMDQMVSDSLNIPLNGYIGRKFAPTYSKNDNYIIENDPIRQDFQLEPGVVITDAGKEIQFASNYYDLLYSIKNYGGLIDNQQRLFASQSYNYNGRYDYDKFVNYYNYYWLPNGPDPVQVYSNQVPSSATFEVNHNNSVGGYTFSDLGTQPNVQLILLRGGNYSFKVSQTSKFYIQSQPGVDGIDPNVPTITTREVFGVSGNGVSDGIINFRVPLKTGQDFFVTMPIADSVNAGTNLQYTDIQNRLLSDFLAEYPDGFDGINNQLQNKTFIFINNDVDAVYWTTPNVPSGYENLDTATIRPGDIVGNADRKSTWKINLIAIDSFGTDYIIQISPETPVTAREKVFITSGKTYTSQQYWLNDNLRYNRVPAITADKDYLYYQDDTNPGFFGTIKLVDNIGTEIDVAEDILGKKGYVSPNGVIFTNGLKVKFDTQVTPASYANNEYYVEGVGDSIALIAVNEMTVTEDYAPDIETQADYITINRASSDQNAWSRSNRWFHKNVLEDTARYNNDIVNYGPGIPGRRPIIEFDTDLQLYNYGINSLGTVDLLTLDQTDVYGTTIAGTRIVGQITQVIDGVTLANDQLVIFAEDYDSNVSNKIYMVEYLDPPLSGDPPYLNLVQIGTVVAGDTIRPTQGDNAGKVFWYDGTSWHEAQEKTEINQAPLFDLVDSNGYSFSDPTLYPSSSFTGTKFFGYAIGTGSNDTILGFPLKYKNFNNIGDIVFKNYYAEDTFTYLLDNNSTTVECATGYLLKHLSDGTSEKITSWTTAVEQTQQYQIYSKFFDGRVLEVNGVERAFVQLDVLPESVGTIPYLKVFLNNKLLTVDVDYQLTTYGVYNIIILLATPEIDDKIDVLVFNSDQVSQLASYETPKNLELNPLNENFTNISLGQIRAHYTKLLENTADLSRPIQDINLKGQGGTLVQHSSPLIYAMTFLNDPNVNFYKSLLLSRKEYISFKNKFLNLCLTLTDIDYLNPITGVDKIMQNINSVKNSSFPWYYSDMVPQGGDYNTIEYTILNRRQINYEINSIFDNTKLSNRAILVYHNNEQLTLGKDYTFSQNVPAILVSKQLEFGDILMIREYSNTDGNYVPETPSKLGLYPKFEPSIFVDDTYQTPTEVIRGHDGSLTPTFGDFRDDFLLELEKRIYNNIKANYNTNEINIYDIVPGRFRETDYSITEFNQLLSNGFLQWSGANNVDYTSNAYYDTNNSWTWNYSEFKDTIDGSKLNGSWRAIYQYWYDTDTPNLTPWHMLGFFVKPSWWEERYGPAPYTSGNGILWEDLEAGYIWNNGDPYYDNRFARPNLSQAYYLTSAAISPDHKGTGYRVGDLLTPMGAYPSTSPGGSLGKIVVTSVTDTGAISGYSVESAGKMAVGTTGAAKVVGGNGSGARFTFSYLSGGFIPVDLAGNLLPPIQIGIVGDYSFSKASDNFVFGQIGPAEAAWRRSSEFPFALQMALALAKPAQYFGTQIDTSQYNVNPITGQFRNSSNKAISPNLLYVNGDISSGATRRTSGYINWVGDYLKNLGIEPAVKIGNYFRYFDVRLNYKLGGFTDKKLLTVTAEQSTPGNTNARSIIPDNNYKIHLNKSVPTASAVYSAVIVQKVASGYSVTGYDISQPFFKILPSIINGNNEEIKILEATGKIYSNGNTDEVTIPYGTTFTNTQQVIDFLVSYGRYLEKVGFRFTFFDSDLQENRDWRTSAKEFLFWSQQGWEIGTIILLNPVASSLLLTTTNTVVDEISNLSTGSRLLDKDFLPIKNNNFNILRYDTPTGSNNTTIVTLDNSIICFAKLDLVQFEHILIFDNTSDFGDIIYIPVDGLRQFRLKLTGVKTGAWNGSLSAHGYIYHNPSLREWQPGVDYQTGDTVKFNNNYYTALKNIPAESTFNIINWALLGQDEIKTGLLPSFGRMAQDFQFIYNIDLPPDNEDQQLFSAGLIGFRPRDYLTELGLSIPVQTKFYQGFIKQKGTQNSITALTRTQFNNVQGAIKTYEEWGVKVGEYGDIENNQYKEFILDQSIFRQNPVAFTLTDNFYTGNIIANLTVNANLLQSNVYNSSNLSSLGTSLYANRNIDYTIKDLPTAGPVHLDDTDISVFDVDNFGGEITVGIGDRIWVAKDTLDRWNVYRVTETDLLAVKLLYTLDDYAELTFDNKHNFSVGDLVVLQGFQTSYFDNSVLQYFDTNYDGIYKVVDSVDNLRVVVQVQDTAKLNSLIATSPIESSGSVLKLVTARLEDITQIDTVTPKHYWMNGDKVWTANVNTNGDWGVYTFNKPWGLENADEITATPATGNDYFGQSISINSEQGYFYVANPGQKQVHVFDYSDNTEYSVISNANPGFAKTLTNQGNLIAISSDGNLHLYRQYSNATVTSLHTINLSTNLSANISSVSISSDLKWIYVGGNNRVEAYTSTNLDHYSIANFITGTGDFGNVVRTDGTGGNLFVAAPTQANTTERTGNVYYYTRSANAFAVHQVISSLSQYRGSQFGFSLDIDSGLGNLFVGSPGSIYSGFRNGLVERYVYDSVSSSYQHYANIAHPIELDGVSGSFGSLIKVTSDAKVLAVNSPGSSAEESTIFDQDETVIDSGSTRFVDSIYNSGTVYLFENITHPAKTDDIGRYDFVQELETGYESRLRSGDGFGDGFDLDRELIVVGAPGTDSYFANGIQKDISVGRTYTFRNETQALAWTITRQQQPRVDIDSVNRTFIYDKTNNNILSAIDIYDPAKGKILNIADKNIDYQVEKDPAKYNAGKVIHTDYHWGPQQVGLIWWDLGAIRYIEYEQDALIYRLNHWGETFPGSEIKIYEWVESQVLPSQYTSSGGSGIPLHADDSAYSTHGYVDQSGNVKLKYYYWVEGVEKINAKASKTLSTVGIKSAIESPRSQDIAYLIPMRNDSVAIYNVQKVLKGKNSILHLGAKLGKAGIVHSEYALVKENNDDSEIPTSIRDKLIDSLAGEDRIGNLVPDPLLPVSQKYGIEIRPRQSMFVDRETALSTYLDIVNSKLIDYPVVQRKVLTILNSQQNTPGLKTGLYDLVVASYTELGFINTVPLSAGYRVLVESDRNYDGKWSIYELDGSKNFVVDTDYIQEYKTNLYWNHVDWFDPGFDPTTTVDYTIETNLDFFKLVLEANKYYKVLDAGNGKFATYFIDSNGNRSTVALGDGTIQIRTDITIPGKELRYILSSMQNEIFVDDLSGEYNNVFFSMLRYALTEQKNIDWAFKTSFLSATQFIRKLEQFPSFIVDNQDFYQQYINEVKPYRTVLREFNINYQKDDLFGGDITDFDLDPYWDPTLNVYRSPSGEQESDADLLNSVIYRDWKNSYTYGVVDYIIGDRGTGYTVPPEIILTGGGGTGANAVAQVFGNGAIANVTVISAGTGYTSIPNILINGTGTGAVLRPVLRNVFDNPGGHNLIRNITTTVKFDRINYTNPNTFVFWDSITTANVGEIIPQDTILVLGTLLYKMISANTITSALDFPYANVTQISADMFDNANDRIVAYNGNIDLYNTTDGIYYPGITVTGDRYFTYDTLEEWTPNTYIPPGTQISYQGDQYVVLGNVQANYFANISANTRLLDTGNTGSRIDTIIQSRYPDDLGISPGNIYIDGGAYVDRYSSHAPQELVPGRMYDSLDLKVFHKWYKTPTGIDANVGAGWRIFNSMNDEKQFIRIANANTTVLTTDFRITDDIMEVDDATRLAQPGTDYPGTVFINGEKVYYYRNLSLETAIPWQSNSAIAESSLITWNGNNYVTTGNVFASNIQWAPNSAFSLNANVFFDGNSYIVKGNVLGADIAWTPNTSLPADSYFYFGGNTYRVNGDSSVNAPYFANIVGNTVQISNTTNSGFYSVLQSGNLELLYNNTDSGFNTIKSFTRKVNINSLFNIRRAVDGTSPSALNISPWIPGVDYPIGSYVSYSGNTYITTGNTYAINVPWRPNTTTIDTGSYFYFRTNTYIATGNVWAPPTANFSYVSSNISFVTANANSGWASIQSNVQFAFTGTDGLRHIANTRVVDASRQQFIPLVDAYTETLGNLQTFTACETVSKKLQLSGNISANVGDFIVQKFANTAVAANLRVLGNVTAHSNVAVIPISGQITTLSGNTITINDVAVSPYVLGLSTLGDISANGNVVVGPGVTLYKAPIWYGDGATLYLDGQGLFYSYTNSSWFVYVQPPYTP